MHDCSKTKLTLDWPSLIFGEHGWKDVTSLVKKPSALSIIIKIWKQKEIVTAQKKKNPNDFQISDKNN